MTTDRLRPRTIVLVGVAAALAVFVLGIPLAAKLTEPAWQDAVPAVMDEPPRILFACRIRMAPTAEDELRELTDLLTSWPTHLADLPAVGTRLTVFEARYGVAPETCAGWPPLTRAAARALDELPARGVASIVGVGLAGVWDGVWWTGVRSLLNELAGCDDEARRLLLQPDRDRREMIHRCCDPGCLFEDMQRHARLVSEYLERHGDDAAALDALFRATIASAYCLDGGTTSPDVDLARLGRLLVYGPHRKAGAAVLHVLRERYPGSLGEQLGAATLAHIGEAERDPDAEIEVFDLRIDWHDPAGTFGFGRAGSSRTHVIAALLPDGSDEGLYDGVLRSGMLEGLEAAFDRWEQAEGPVPSDPTRGTRESGDER